LIQSMNGDVNGHRGLHPADHRDLRVARPGTEVGRATVSFENTVGLALSVLVALFLVAALLFPERF
jgi:K+-transporting ATPase KdpF subunit